MLHYDWFILIVGLFKGAIYTIKKTNEENKSKYDHGVTNRNLLF